MVLRGESDEGMVVLGEPGVAMALREETGIKVLLESVATDP